MKICYVDESGNQDGEPCLVMVGLLVDAARLNRTRNEFGDIFSKIESLFGETLKELKGSKLLFGKDRWRKVDPEIRKQVVDYLVSWIAERNHHLLLSAIDRSTHARADKTELPECADDIWLLAGLHIALQVQKANQGKKNNKGHTFLVFDDNKQKADTFAELLWDAPMWTDDYYGKKRKQWRLDQVIDTAFTIRSHHAGLVQVADLYAFLFRRFAQLKDYGGAEEWNGEASLISSWVHKLSERLIPLSARWPKRTTSKSSAFITQFVPPSIREL